MIYQRMDHNLVWLSLTESVVYFSVKMLDINIQIFQANEEIEMLGVFQRGRQAAF